MFRDAFSRPGRWVALVLGAVTLVTAVSFTRFASAQTFQPGSQIPVRGTPMSLRPAGTSFTWGGVTYGPFPPPVQVIPLNPPLPAFPPNTRTPNTMNTFPQLTGGYLGGISGNINGIS